MEFVKNINYKRGVFMALGKKANKKTDNMKSKSGGSIFKKKSEPVKKKRGK